MNHMEKKERFALWSGLLGTALLVALDQWTKRLAVMHLKDQPAIPLIPGVFQLQYLENRGAAFGLLQNQQWLFLLLCGVFVGAIVYIYRKIPKTRRFLPLHLLSVLAVAGGIGNAIDRAVQGYVVDFFYFSLIDFPIFNVADCYVVACAFLLFYFLLFYYREEELTFLPFGKSSEKPVKTKKSQGDQEGRK